MGTKLKVTAREYNSSAKHCEIVILTLKDANSFPAEEYIVMIGLVITELVLFGIKAKEKIKKKKRLLTLTYKY